MSDIIFGVSLGLIVFFILIGFLVGLIRGVKRSAVHIAFVVVSILVAFFITRPVVNLVLGIVIDIDGSMMTFSDYILSYLYKFVNERIRCTTSKKEVLLQRLLNLYYIIFGRIFG